MKTSAAAYLANAVALEALDRVLERAIHSSPAIARGQLTILLSNGARRIGARAPKAAQLAAEHYARRQPRIAALHEAISQVLEKARRQTLSRLRKHHSQLSTLNSQPLLNSQGDATGVAGDIAFDLPQFRAGLLGRIRTESASTLQAAGDEAFEELGAQGYADLDPFSMPHPKSLEFFQSRENKLKDIPAEMHAEIMDTITEGVQAGKSIAQMARDLREKFAAIEEGRAATIASTETGAAYGFARQESFTMAGVTYKTWLTSHLPTVRATHRDAEEDARNQAVPIGEPFHVGADLLMFPGDPAGSPEEVINCHCVALATEKEEA